MPLENKPNQTKPKQIYPYVPASPLGQEMTQGQFLSGI